MKETNQDNALHRKLYVSPEITTTVVELEQGIAADSAKVDPGGGPVQEEWKEEEDGFGSVDW
jgi:hypothetical protein